MIVKHKLIADITRRGPTPQIDAMQNDKYSRDIELRLQTNGIAFTPPAGCSVLVRYQKSDGTGGIYDTLPDGKTAWKISGDVLTVTLAPQICTAPGPVQVAVSLLMGKSEICCQTLQVNVHPHPGLSKISESYLNVTQFIPQPGNAQVGQYLKIADVDSFGRISVVGADGGGSGTGSAATLEITNAVTLEYGSQPTVTELDGSISSARQYRLGIPQGKPGDTPVRGIDYWTEADQETVLAEAREYIASHFADSTQLEANFANSVESCTDTSKVYILPDGYIYAYTASTGGTNFTNLADPDSSDWLTDYRINSSGSLVSASGVLITNFIDISNIANIHLKGLDIQNPSANGENYGRIYAYDAGMNQISGTAQPSTKPDFFQVADYDETVLIVDIANAFKYWFTDSEVRYIRFGGFLTVDTAKDVIITADESIIYSENSYAWRNTGHAFVPADYEDRILALEEQAADHAEELEKLQDLESGDAASIPDYWQSAVDTAVSKVKALQDEGGSDVVNFIWFSDMHYVPDDSYVKNIGSLCAAVMEACDIPLTLMSGDTMSAAVVDSEDTLLTWLDGAKKTLSPIGFDRLMQIRGNHDDVYGKHIDGDTTVSYVNKAAPSKIWNRLHRHQANDFRRVFGGDGTYFYLDNPTQKLRFVCLNSHFYDGGGITGGTVKAMTNGFGSAQLDWLQNTALAVDDGWDVVIATHIPPSASAINGTVYLSQYSDGDTFRSIVTAAAANIIGIFCGHCHVDAVVTNDLACPILTVTCAINTPYDGTSADRVAGTDKETAIDIVSINKAEKTIHLTRLGAGSDREVQYAE